MIEKKGYTVNDDSTLLKFGNAFQSKIIALLLTKKSFKSMVLSAAPRLVAFDLDGTLLDSTEAIIMSVKNCWKACGFKVPKTDRIRRIIGLPWEESIRELIPDAGDTEFSQIRQFYL